MQYHLKWNITIYTLSSDNETSVNELTSKKNLDNEHDNERCITSNFLDMFYLDNKLFTKQITWTASKCLVTPKQYREIVTSSPLLFLEGCYPIIVVFYCVLDCAISQWHRQTKLRSLQSVGRLY